MTQAPPPSPRVLATELVDPVEDSPRAIVSRVTARLANVVVWVAAPVAFGVSAIAVLRDGWSPSVGAYGLLQVVAIAVLRGWRGRSSHAAGHALFLYGYLHAILATFMVGPAMGIGVLCVLAGLWSAVSLGRRGAWLNAGFMFAAAMGIGLLFEVALLVRPDGSMLDVREPLNWVRMAVTMAAGGVVNGWVVSEILGEQERGARRAERTLAMEEQERSLSDELVRQLHQSQRLETLHRLAGGAGHDIMNALAVVLCNAEMLRKTEDSFQEELAGEVFEAATSAAKISRQLMALGEREPLAAGSTEPAALIERTGRLLRRSLPPSIDLRLEARTERPIAKMPEGGRLAVTLSNVESGLRRGGVLIEVEDDGVGMDDATRDRIFEPFFTTKGPGVGTGMGLAVVHGLVTSAHGAITVSSALGAGTTIRVELPAPQPASEQAPRTSASSQAEGGRVILLVEDDARVRAVMRRVLQAAGHEVVEAGDGAAAVTALGSLRELDLLITDGVLPDLPTQELIEDVLAQHARAQVVVCSGYSEEVLSQRGIDLSRCERLPKPFTAAELRAVAAR
jgi:signal transduction histidine kinase